MDNVVIEIKNNDSRGYTAFVIHKEDMFARAGVSQFCDNGEWWPTGVSWRTDTDCSPEFTERFVQALQVAIRHARERDVLTGISKEAQQ